MIYLKDTFIYEKIDPKTFHNLAKFGDSKIFKIIFNIVEDKNPKNKFGRTLLHEVAECGHEKVAKIILDVVQGIAITHCIS